MKPKLRFNEFNDEWNKVKISSIVQELKIKTGNTEKYPLWSLTIENGVTLKTDRYERSFLVKKDDNYKIVEPNNYVYNPMNAHLGAIARNKSNTTISVSGYYDIFKINNKNYSFYDNYFVSPVMFKQYKLISTGSLLEKQRVHYSQFKELEINLPTNKEQVKISNFLSLLDKKIELQSKKIEDLKLFKKGLILSLKKNSFDWHTVCIKDLFKITRGVVIPKNELSEFKNGEYKYPVYSSQTSNQGTLGYSDTFDFNGKYLTWTTDGANAGKVFYRNGKFRCTNVCGILYEDNIKFTNELFAELLNYETPKHVSYVGNPKLMNNVMADIKIKIPNGEVQENTSLIINTINNKVNLEKNKLLKFKELKKGLMQNMFV